MIELVDASVLRAGRRILSNVSLRIEPGALTALLGPNGAGKTTLLRLIAGELHPDRGRIMLDERDLSSFGPRELARRRSVLAQRRSVGFGFSVREVVEMGRYAFGLPDADGPAAVDRALELVDAEHLALRRYDSLSGGEAARVDVARVLAQGSSLVLLDEPTNHLDLRVQYDILALFHRLTQHGITVVAALHDLNHAAHFADHVVLMKDGEIVTSGLPGVVLQPSLLQTVYALPCAISHAYGRRIIVHL